jgi:dethiobiotin synthetase
MPKRIFITGIDTDVGKTLVSAIVCQSLEADYWKPVQAGDIEKGDKYTVHSLVSNTVTKIHKNTYALTSPMSPHAAASIDGIKINPDDFIEPSSENTMVIEGAGGLLVPLNDQITIIDLIKPSYHVIVVSKHYLGSINHSLMTIQLLQARGFAVSVIFNGDENNETESIIQSMTNVNVIGRINQEDSIDKDIINRYAEQFKIVLSSL